MRSFKLLDWNEEFVKLYLSNNWRASLVPAAAVIPAPVAYIKVAAFKKLVVGLNLKAYHTFSYIRNFLCYFEKNRVFHAVVMSE